jgi:hypothetical protein
MRQTEETQGPTRKFGVRGVRAASAIRPPLRKPLYGRQRFLVPHRIA